MFHYILQKKAEIFMNVIDYGARFFLAFSNDTLLVPLIIIGFLYVNNRTYGQALIVLLFSLVFNTVLKRYFGIPLNLNLNIEGFAFPSGHMQSATVFYGWIYAATNNIRLRIIIIVLLSGISFGLHRFGYHNVYDILAGVSFGVLIIVMFNKLTKTKILQKHPYSLGFFVIPLVAASIFYSCYFNNITTQSQTWMFFYILIGFTISWFIFQKQVERSKSLFSKLLSVILSFIVIAGVFYLLPTFKSLLPANMQIQWLVVGIIIPLSSSLARAINIIKKL